MGDDMYIEANHAGCSKRYDSVDEHPVTPVDYRFQIEKLSIEIDHIGNQLYAAKLSIEAGNKAVDPVWMRKTGDALRHKREAMLKLEGELDKFAEKRTEMLIDIVREEFDDEAWDSIVKEAEDRTSQFFQGA